MNRPAERRDGLESHSFEHRRGSVSGLIPKSSRSPLDDRIRFNDATAFLPDGFQSGLQRKARHAASAVSLIDNETSYPPQSPCADFRSKFSIVTTLVDTWKLLAATVLAPTDWLSLRIHEHPMRAPRLDQRDLVSPVPHASLSSAQLVIPGREARSMEVHTPTEVPPISSREEPLKVSPGLFRQLLCSICRTLRRAFHRGSSHL